MEEARAFAPGNVSCVFKIVPHENPAKMHSLGMGFTVSDGAYVVLRRASETTVRFNGEVVHFPTVVSAVQKLTAQPLRVNITSVLPLSAGFGLSGASALAAVYALNALLGLEKPEVELAMAAHVAEVENLTGLGDVCGQYHGGCLIKLRAGDPLAAEPLAVSDQPIYYRFFEPIHTADILSDQSQRERINRAADVALRRLEAISGLDTVDFNECIGLSKTFAVDSGLLRHRGVQQVIESIEAKSGRASMMMLGHAVFSSLDFEGAKRTMLGSHRVRVV